MSILRKAAQDVIDQYHKDKSYLSADIDGDKIEALREALQAEPEPVAMRYDGDGYGYRYIDNGSGSDWRTRHKDAEALYTTPPSVDTLISEIASLGAAEKDGSDWLNFYKVQAILDKYRSNP